MIDIENFVLKKSVERNPLLRIHLTALKAFGYVLFDDQRRKRLHCLRGVIFTASFVIFNASQFVDLFQKLDNIDELTKNAATTLLFATTSFRMVNFYRNRRRYLKVVETVDEELQQLTTLRADDDKVKEIVASSIKYQRWLTASFWIIALITGNLMCINAAVQAFFNDREGSATPQLILPSWFPFDQCKYFWLIYAMQFYVMYIGMLIVPCWHSFIVSIKIFVIIKMKVLNHDLSQLPRNSQKELAKCVDEREKLFEFVKELAALISDSIFLDFVVFSILLCALLFQASQVGIGVQLAITFFYILTMTTILWMYYHHANEITFYSDQLTTSAYKCPWYESSVRFRKDFVILISSAKEIKLRAAFIDMRLDTFVTILRASYSFFTLLTHIDSD